MLDAIILILKLTGAFSFHALSILHGEINKTIHKFTYKSVPEPQNVVVIGASFAGYHAARQLANSLPIGWRVVVIEKNSHFQFSWVFPRFAVVSGHEHKAFIPYGSYLSGAPTGSYKFVRDEVVEVFSDAVVLRSGEKVPFEYLVVATGAKTSAPSRLNVESKKDGIDVLHGFQERIRNGKSIVVVGGGPAGVELAADAKSQYPEKSITLVHSREQLLNHFGRGLHDAAMKELGKLGVKVVLGQRVSPNLDEGRLRFKSGEEIDCDCLVRSAIVSLNMNANGFQIKSTGQGFASSLISRLTPTSISASGGIDILPTLQVKDPNFRNIFAIGDVVDFGRHLNSLSACFQADTAARNIVSAIAGSKMREYSPQWWENGIKLTLGIVSHHSCRLTQGLFRANPPKGKERHVHV
jgi:apoptosis-inducing factor 2